MFWTRIKQPPTEDLVTLKIRMTKLEGEMLDLAQTIDTLRNKVLRKIQIKQERDLDQDDQPASKDPYNGMLIPER